jgi:hypothetical protein
MLASKKVELKFQSYRCGAHHSNQRPKQKNDQDLQDLQD